MDTKLICEQVITLTKATGNFIREQRKNFSVSQIESKGLHDFVSYVDKESEKQLVAGLSKILPEAGFIAEEGTGQRNSNGLNWIIDPLDGTTNFIHGLPPYAISIALMDNETILLGVIYEVTLDECFYSWGQMKAFVNGNPISVSKTAKVADSLIATGFPYYDYERIGPFLQSMEHFMRYSHGLRRLGSAATDLAYVACGRVDSFYEYSLQPWDVAAGAFIVEQAGGQVCDFSGTKNYIFGKEIIAANGKTFDELKTIVARFLKK
ncbi:MAG TPA: inositol monophosphatase family protein [Tenuifilaceae bacterium]|nr:inositol monophosphatase family protein [Tenuifilaceae bacterium]